MYGDWSLSGEQMLFLMQHSNMIAAAMADDNFDAIRNLAVSKEFVSRFGPMGFDEAYDRYATIIAGNSSWWGERYELDELLTQVTDDNLHKEWFSERRKQDEQAGQDADT